MSVIDLVEPQIITEDKAGDYIDNLKRLNVGSGSKTMKSDENGLFLGADKFATAPFRVDYDGNLISTSGAFSGAITASTIDIGTNGFHVDSSGNMWWGSSATYAGATIKISSAGSVNFTTGTFSGTLSAAAGTLGTITAGTLNGLTITGGTIQTATTGYRLKMNGSNNRFESLNGDTVLGYIDATADGDMNINATDDIVFRIGGSSKCGVFSAYFRPTADNTYILGKSDFRWNDFFTTKISLDNWTFTQDGSGRLLIQLSGADYMRIDTDGDLHIKSGRSFIADL